MVVLKWKPNDFKWRFHLKNPPLMHFFTLPKTEFLCFLNMPTWLLICTFLWSSDSKAIVDGNLKLILGLIWTLILHYSISMPMWDEEEEADDGRQKTPKQRLLGWIQNKLPELPITNFNKDWQTGRALGALVDSCAPGEGGNVWILFMVPCVGNGGGKIVVCDPGFNEDN